MSFTHPHTASVEFESLPPSSVCSTSYSPDSIKNEIRISLYKRHNTRRMRSSMSTSCMSDLIERGREQCVYLIESLEQEWSLSQRKVMPQCYRPLRKSHRIAHRCWQGDMRFEGLHFLYIHRGDRVGHHHALETRSQGEVGSTGVSPFTLINLCTAIKASAPVRMRLLIIKDIISRGPPSCLWISHLSGLTLSSHGYLQLSEGREYCG